MIWFAYCGQFVASVDWLAVGLFSFTNKANTRNTRRAQRALMAEPNALERLSPGALVALRNALVARNRARNPRARVSDLGGVELPTAAPPLAPAPPEPALVEDMPIDRGATLPRLAQAGEDNTDSMRDIQAPIETEMTGRELDFAEIRRNANMEASRELTWLDSCCEWLCDPLHICEHKRAHESRSRYW